MKIDNLLLDKLIAYMKLIWRKWGKESSCNKII